jgi:hypothetical protein
VYFAAILRLSRALYIGYFQELLSPFYMLRKNQLTWIPFRLSWFLQSMEMEMAALGNNQYRASKNSLKIQGDFELQNRSKTLNVFPPIGVTKSVKKAG